MQNLLLLNDLYHDFLSGCLSKQKFEAAIFEAIRDDIHTLNPPGLTKHDYDDFISWLSFRIGRAISTYRDIGSSFDAYINAMVRMSAKEYRAQQVREYTEETAAWFTQLPDMFVGEDEPEYDKDASAEAGAPEILKNPRQVLILLLKCSSYISMEFLEKIAPRLGMEPDDLMKMIDALKRQREKRERVIEALQKRINHQFYRCIFMERVLHASVEETGLSMLMRTRLERGRERLAKMRERIAGMRLDPSNEQIAKLLGISKNTVDTTLYALRKNTTLG